MIAAIEESACCQCACVRLVGMAMTVRVNFARDQSATLTRTHFNNSAPSVLKTENVLTVDVTVILDGATLTALPYFADQTAHQLQM